MKELLSKPIQPRLQDNIEMIEQILEHSADLIRRDLIFRHGKKIPAAIYYTDGLVNTQDIDSGVLKPLLVYSPQFDELTEEKPEANLVETIKETVLQNTSLKLVTTFQEVIDGILSGDTLLFLEDCKQGILLRTKGWDARAIDEPVTETVVRGPRDGFTENIRTNTALLRRRIRDPLLRIDSMVVGESSKTDINIAYLKGTVKEGLIDEIKQRISRIKIDAILGSGYIEEFIQDAPLSPFTTIQSTERPDKVAASLYEGRAAIFVDNTPFALIVPTYFWQYMQATDDYYSRFWVGSFFRIIRYIAFLISLTLPSFYVMLVSFHQEMIPTALALTIASGREVVPLPVLFEALIMELAFELMREAGIRMPRPIGQAVSIVGSLVIGQAAVQAGIVSPFMVIIVAITGISSFAIPNYAASFSIRLMRFPLLVASGTFGLLGFAVSLSAIIIHALSLRSFGEPFLAPFTPFRPSDQKDILYRPPWWSMHRKPQMADGDPQRQKSHQMPHPPRQRGSDDGSKKTNENAEKNSTTEER